RFWWSSLSDQSPAESPRRIFMVGCHLGRSPGHRESPAHRITHLPTSAPVSKSLVDRSDKAVAKASELYREGAQQGRLLQRAWGAASDESKTHFVEVNRSRAWG